jgi:gluconolactonase
MRLAAMLALSLAACGGGDDRPRDGSIIVLHDSNQDGPLAGIGEVEQVDTGFMFLEGPQWIADDGLLLFSDIPADTIYQLAPPSTVTEFRSPSGNSNGLGLLPDGRLLAAEHGGRRVSIDYDTTLAGDYLGDTLNSPNDVIARSDGTVYFTDPPYGIDEQDRELDFMGVFRVTPDGEEITAEWMGPLSARPNGIALSPDESILYVADTIGVLRAYDVDATDGTLSGERVVSDEVPQADGMAVDDDGNLFVTTADGVRVLAPDGTIWGTIEIGEVPANCAFGGPELRTLYVTARTSLYRVDLANPGLP